MTPQERCAAAEGSLARAGQLLLNPTPDAVEECVQALSQAAEALQALALGTPRDWDAAVHRALKRVQTGARELAPRIEHGSQLVRGWMHLKLGEGYTRGGAPRFAEPQAERHLEA